MPHQETLDRVEYLSDYSSKDRRWDSTRSSADRATLYFEQSEYSSHARRCRECARRLTFNLAIANDASFKLKLKSVYLCHVRLCPICQVCRTRVWNARFDRAIPQIIEANPTIKFLMLTLTVKNCPIDQLRDTLQLMSHAFSKLMKRTPVKKVVLGYIRSMEITKGKDSSAHPHFHVLLAVKNGYFSRDYINHQQWVKMWQESLEVEYTPVVDIRAARPKKGQGNDKDSLISAIREVAKYTVKVSDLLGTGTPKDQQWFIEMVKQLHAVKQMNIAGVFREYLKQDEATPDEILQGLSEETDEEIEEINNQLFFTWSAKRQKYFRFSA